MRIKRFLSLALCVCLLLGLLPSVGLHASAAEATICMNFVTENTRWSYGGVDFDCNRDSSRNITTADNGWAWYGAGNEVYAAKTLVLEPTFRLDTTNNVGILLPAGSKIVYRTTEEAGPYIRASRKNNDSNAYGVHCKGDLTVCGSDEQAVPTGLTILAGDSSSAKDSACSIGLWVEGTLTLDAAKVNVTGGSIAGRDSYGVFAEKDVVVTDSVLTAHAGAASGRSFGVFAKGTLRAASVTDGSTVNAYGYDSDAMPRAEGKSYGIWTLKGVSAEAGEGGVTVNGYGASVGGDAYSCGILISEGDLRVSGTESAAQVNGYYGSTEAGMAFGLRVYGDLSLDGLASVSGDSHRDALVRADCYGLYLTGAIKVTNPDPFTAPRLSAAASSTGKDKPAYGLYATGKLELPAALSGHFSGTSSALHSAKSVSYDALASGTTTADLSEPVSLYDWKASGKDFVKDSKPARVLTLHPGYDVWIGSHRISPKDKLSDVLGDGTVAYTPAKTESDAERLTIRDLSLHADGCSGIRSFHDLTVDVQGANTISAKSAENACAILSYGSLRLEGKGSLVAASEQADAIRAEEGITLHTLVLKASSGASYAVQAVSGKLSLISATLDAIGTPAALKAATVSVAGDVTTKVGEPLVDWDRREPLTAYPQVSVTVNPPCKGDETCPGHAFADMPEPNNWAHVGIDFAVKHRLFEGTAPDAFEPDGTMTRAMLVTVLWRLAGRPECTDVSPFTDVSHESLYYYVPVAWAARNGIVNGVSPTEFEPDSLVTREQMAAIMFRYAKFREYDLNGRADLSYFPDLGSVSEYAAEPLAWANYAGLITGTNGDDGIVVIAPADGATRAQVAAILMRFMQYYGLDVTEPASAETR